MPGLGELIRRCLEKRPETRFESARDFAYALDILASAARSRSNSSQATSVPAPAMPSVSIRQLTFREGAVSAARFAPDGVTVVYRAAWEGEPPQIYLSRTDNPDYQPLRLGNSQLLAVSSTAELAIGLDPRDMGGFVHLHTLARVSMLGGVPRELAKNVFAADWGPGGRAMAAIREVDGRFRIEYPLGTVLHEVSGWLSQIRVSADGKHLAFFEHPFGGNNAGDLRVMDASGGPPRTLVRAMESALTLAWHPSGKEIWFAASFVGEGAGLVYAVTLDGQMRVVYQTLGWPELHDFSSEGEALLLRSKPRLRLQTGTRSGGDSSRQELSWLDWSLLRDMTPDGTTVLFDETGPGVMHGASVYCRRTDGSPAVRIADGIAMGFLPDGKHVLALGGTAADRTFTVCPLGAGDARRIDTGELFCHFARPHPDGRTAIVLGNHSGEPVGLYRMSLETGAYERMTNEAVTITSPIVLPNGDVITRLANGTFAVVPASGGPTRPIAGLAGDERPAVSGQGDTQIFTFRRGQIPCPVARVDLETGRREAWLEIEPMTRSGTESFVSVAMTPDGERYTGAFTQQVADLFVVTGLV